MSKLTRHSLVTCIRTGLLALAFVVLPTLSATAAPPPATIGGTTEAKTYVYQYFLVGLCIALGLALLCRPRSRQQEVERIAE